MGTKREVVEISAAGLTHNDCGISGLYARCADGSLWALFDDTNWKRLPDIPTEVPTDA